VGTDVPIKIAIMGAGGRMGREVAAAAMDDKEVMIVGAAEAAGNPAIGQDLGRLCGQPESGIRITADSEAVALPADVLVEFSAPAASVEHALLAAQLGKAHVIGTTGLSAEQMTAVQQAAAQVPILVAPNMSLGVNLLLKILPLIAKTLGDGYDVEIVESHHRHKKDAPSGTALALGRAIAQVLGRDWEQAAVYGRQGVKPRQPGEIGVHALRAGGNVGEHWVIFGNEGEQIELSHRAFSRQTFALGALRAAKFLASRPPGLYTMLDVLEV